MFALLPLAFVIVPILEILVILQVGQVIGGWQTAALLVVESLLGAWLVRREGRRAWRTLRDTFGSGRLPTREIADGALVLVGGTLLLTPGFLTDVVGFFFVLPFTRPLARQLLMRWLAARARRLTVVTLPDPRARGQHRSRARGGETDGATPYQPGDVLEGEVVPGPSSTPGAGWVDGAEGTGGAGAAGETWRSRGRRDGEDGPDRTTRRP